MTKLGKHAILIILLTATAGCAQDKYKHMAAGSAGAYAAYSVTKSRKAACATAIALGVGKELWDSTGRGQLEAMDIVATAVPCLSLAIEF